MDLSKNLSSGAGKPPAPAPSLDASSCHPSSLQVRFNPAPTFTPFVCWKHWWLCPSPAQPGVSRAPAVPLLARGSHPAQTGRSLPTGVSQGPYGHHHTCRQGSSPPAAPCAPTAPHAQPRVRPRGRISPSVFAAALSAPRSHPASHPGASGAFTMGQRSVVIPQAGQASWIFPPAMYFPLHLKIKPQQALANFIPGLFFPGSCRTRCSPCTSLQHGHGWGGVRPGQGCVGGIAWRMSSPDRTCGPWRGSFLFALLGNQEPKLGGLVCGSGSMVWCDVSTDTV